MAQAVRGNKALKATVARNSRMIIKLLLYLW